MNEQEKLLKRKIQYIVVGAMTLFFILVTVVVFQFAIRINLKNQENSLLKQNEHLQKQIDQAQNDIDYYSSIDFIEDYALRYLNKGQPGDKIFN